VATRHAEYRCAACKKIIKSNVVACRRCVGKFFHPGCMNKHNILDKNNECVTCTGPFDRFLAETDEEKTRTRDRDEEKRGIEMEMETHKHADGPGPSMVKPAGASDAQGENAKLKDYERDVLIGMVINLDKKMSDIQLNMISKEEADRMKSELKSELERVYKEEAKKTRKELENVKDHLGKELENVKDQLRRLQQEQAETTTKSRMTSGPQQDTAGKKSISSYSDVVQRKKEAVIVVKPKKQLESETTKKVIKENVDIKSMNLGVSRFRKGQWKYAPRL